MNVLKALLTSVYAIVLKLHSLVFRSENVRTRFMQLLQDLIYRCGPVEWGLGLVLGCTHANAKPVLTVAEQKELEKLRT